MQRRSFLQRVMVAATAAGWCAGFGPRRARAAAAPRVRIAQIGTGHAHAAGKLEAVRSLAETYEVLGVVESDPALRATAARQAVYAGLDWLDEEAVWAAADVPVVAVETRLADACTTAARAVKAGKHVHLDKPGAVRHADFRAMRTEAERRGLTVQMGYMLRYNPAFELLFRAAREEWFGEITEVDCAMGKLAAAPLRAELKEVPGGGMFELACHLVDAVVTVLGRPVAVHAVGTPTRRDGVRDNQLAVLVYPRLAATIRCNHADPFGFPRRFFAIAGTQGAMEIRQLESGRLRLWLSEPHGGYPIGEQAIELAVPRSRYAAEFVDLAAVVRGEKKLAWDAAHDVAVHATALEAAGVGGDARPAGAGTD